LLCCATRWRRLGAVWMLSTPDAPEPMRPRRKPRPANLEFEIIYDEDQGKLAGLPFYGFAARPQFVDGGLQPPPD
jgi:hypothetical protein